MVALRLVEPPPIFKMAYALDVTDAVAQLYDGGDYWNRHKLRTEQYVHSDVDDIWLRFHPWEEGLSLADYNQPHQSVWYPIAQELPALVNIVTTIWKYTIEAAVDRLVEFGGVLVTRIPPGGRVEPHTDSGWHAEHYNTKVAVQLVGHKDQAFCYDGHRCVAETGELYGFDNLQEHWIENNSDIDRVTLIICMRINARTR